MLSSIWFFWGKKNKGIWSFLVAKRKRKTTRTKKRKKKKEDYKSNIKFLQISLSLMKILVVIDILVIIRFDGYIEKY